MNTFSAIDFDDIQLQPGDTVWLVGNDNGEYMIQIDAQADYSQGEGEDDTPSDDTPAADGTGDGTGDDQGDTQTVTTRMLMETVQAVKQLSILVT